MAVANAAPSNICAVRVCTATRWQTRRTMGNFALAQLVVESEGADGTSIIPAAPSLHQLGV